MIVSHTVIFYFLILTRSVFQIMDPSRIADTYDETIINLMEDMGVNSQIKQGRSYRIVDGKLCPEPENWVIFGKRIMGYQLDEECENKTVAWTTTARRTIQSYISGTTVKDTILSYCKSHKKSVITASKKILANKDNLKQTGNFHNEKLLENFTEKMEADIRGLKNLRETYLLKHEGRFVSAMDTIIKSLEDQLEENNRKL